MNLQELRQAYKVKTGKFPSFKLTQNELIAKLELLGNPTPEMRPAQMPIITTTSTDIPVQIRPEQTDDRIAKLERMVEMLQKENATVKDENFKLQEGWQEYVPPQQQNKSATLKVYRKDADSPAGVVIKCTTFKDNEFNEETRKYDRLVYSIVVKYDDNSTEEVKIDSEQFYKSREIEKVEIIREERRVLKKVDDYTTVSEKDKEGYPKRMLSGGSGYGSPIGGFKVPLEVFMVKSDVVVRRKNGQEISMSSDFLNL